MTKASEQKTIMTDDHLELDKRANKFYREGFRPLGFPTVIVDISNGDNIVKFYQTFIKFNYAKKKEPWEG